MAKVEEHIEIGTETVPKKVLQAILIEEMGLIDDRTHDRWIAILQTLGFIKRKNAHVFWVVANKGKALEEFGAPEVEVE
jgi:hypothetical protein